MDTEDTHLDSIFQAFGHSKRRGMIYSLSFRPATITQLANEYDLSLPAIHKHIKLLEQADLIHRRKVGRTNFIALNAKTITPAQDWVLQFKTGWGNNGESLENYIAKLNT